MLVGVEFLYICATSVGPCAYKYTNQGEQHVQKSTSRPCQSDLILLCTHAQFNSRRRHGERIILLFVVSWSARRRDDQGFGLHRRVQGSSLRVGRRVLLRGRHPGGNATPERRGVHQSGGGAAQLHAGDRRRVRVLRPRHGQAGGSQLIDRSRSRE